LVGTGGLIDEDVTKLFSLRVSGEQDESVEKHTLKHLLYNIVVAIIIIALFSNSSFVFRCLPLEI
jgi:hypothetical protein